MHCEKKMMMRKMKEGQKRKKKKKFTIQSAIGSSLSDTESKLH